MRRLIMVLGVAAVVGAFGASTVEAQRLGGPGNGRAGVGGPRGVGQRLGPLGGPGRQGRALFAVRAFRQLDLSDAQKTQIKDIVAKSRDEVAPLMKQIRDKRQETRAAIQGGTAPDVARSAARSDLAGVQKQLADVRAKTRAALQGVLTPEQLDQLKTLRQKRPRN